MIVAHLKDVRRGAVDVTTQPAEEAYGPEMSDSTSYPLILAAGAWGQPSAIFVPLSGINAIGWERFLQEFQFVMPDVR